VVGKLFLFLLEILNHITGLNKSCGVVSGLSLTLAPVSTASHLDNSAQVVAFLGVENQNSCIFLELAVPASGVFFLDQEDTSCLSEVVLMHGEGNLVVVDEEEADLRITILRLQFLTDDIHMVTRKHQNWFSFLMNSLVNSLVEQPEKFVFILANLLVDGVSLDEMTGELRLRLELRLVVCLPTWHQLPERFKLIRCSGCEGVDPVCSEVLRNSLEKRILSDVQVMSNLDRTVLGDIVSFINENDKVRLILLFKDTSTVLYGIIIDVLLKNVLELVD